MLLLQCERSVKGICHIQIMTVAHSFCSSMPPFGKEPSESSAKPVPFLRLGHATRASRQRRVAASAFGQEPAEADSLHRSGTATSSRCSSSLSSKRGAPFQDEGAENQKSSKLKSTSFQPFQAEGDEFGSGSSDAGSDCEQDFAGRSDSVFALGWQSMLTLKNASFWKENCDDLRAKPKKRAYNNKNRAAQASYSKKDQEGIFKQRGSDEKRLQSLFHETTCKCAIHWN